MVLSGEAAKGLGPRAQLPQGGEGGNALDRGQARAEFETTKNNTSKEMLSFVLFFT